jgi:uncharacterized protein YkwD
MSSDFVEECLLAHNVYRSLHGSPPLQWDPRLATSAQQWAEILLKQGVLFHGNLDVPGLGRYSQNVAFAGGAKWPITKATSRWYSEIVDYDFRSATPVPGTGHFSCMVWRSTTHVGVGVARGSRGTYVVASYFPAGNVLGRYQENVLASRSSSSWCCDPDGQNLTATWSEKTAGN